MNKAINLCINFSLSLALLIALSGTASAQNATGELTGSSADQPATTTSTSSTDAHTETSKAKQGKTGSAKRTAAAGTGASPPADMRGWVPRIDYKHCPNGTTTYVAGDGGVKCWAGPVD